jgi:hypothetical protein
VNQNQRFNTTQVKRGWTGSALGSAFCIKIYKQSSRCYYPVVTNGIQRISWHWGHTTAWPSAAANHKKTAMHKTSVCSRVLSTIYTLQSVQTNFYMPSQKGFRFNISRRQCPKASHIPAINYSQLMNNKIYAFLANKVDKLYVNKVNIIHTPNSLLTALNHHTNWIMKHIVHRLKMTCSWPKSSTISCTYQMYVQVSPSLYF